MKQTKEEIIELLKEVQENALVPEIKSRVMSLIEQIKEDLDEEKYLRESSERGLKLEIFLRSKHSVYKVDAYKTIDESNEAMKKDYKKGLLSIQQNLIFLADKEDFGSQYEIKEKRIGRGTEG